MEEATLGLPGPTQECWCQLIGHSGGCEAGELGQSEGKWMGPGAQAVEKFGSQLPSALGYPVAGVPREQDPDLFCGKEANIN